MHYDDDLLPLEPSFGADPRLANVPGGGGGLGAGGGLGSGGLGGGGGLGSGGGGGGAARGQKFWETGGAELAGTALGGLFELLQTGILVESAKNNPQAAALLTQFRELEAAKAAGGDVDAQIAALAAQNAALLQQMQLQSQPKGISAGWVVAGVLGFGVLATGLLVVLTRRTGTAGARNELPYDPSVFDLDRSQWEYVG